MLEKGTPIGCGERANQYLPPQPICSHNSQNVWSYVEFRAPVEYNQHGVHVTEHFHAIASSEAKPLADDQQRSGMLAMQRSAVVKRQAGSCTYALACSPAPSPCRLRVSLSAAATEVLLVCVLVHVDHEVLASL